jgi:pyruvate kinase
MARGAWRIVNDIKAKLLVVWTTTGQTARVFSKHRFPVPIIAMSNDHRILRRMAINFGVIPHETLAAAEMSVLIEMVDEMVLTKKLAEPNDRILIVAGWSAGTPGTMNGLVLHTVGQKWTPVPNPQILRQLLKAERS